MKKVYMFTTIAIISLILLIVGNVNAKTDEKEGAAAMFSFLILVWIFSAILSIPVIKIKNKSTLLTIVAWVQAIAPPLNVIIGPVYLILLAQGKLKEDEGLSTIKVQGVANEN